MLWQNSGEALTLVVNLFAGPGAGKSTTRAGVFHKLKLAGYNVEEATEFAKLLTWEKRSMAFTCQPYIFGKQLYALHRLAGQVDAVITDSPLVLSSIYAPEDEPLSFHNLVIDKFQSFKNINFFINRVKPYNPKGRNQDLKEAQAIDDKVKRYLKAWKIGATQVDGDEQAAEFIASEVRFAINATT
jgi:hypothetical protein